MRLIANPYDDQAFEAALDNDVVLTAYSQHMRTYGAQTSASHGIDYNRNGANGYAVSGSTAQGIVDAMDVKNVIIPTIWKHYRECDCDSLLDAAREAVLSNDLEGKYHFVMANFLRKFDSWKLEADRSYRQGSANIKRLCILFFAVHMLIAGIVILLKR